jgi:putative FmdB family regulatory protein
MPIYDFQCNDCGRKFEQLCRLNWQGSVVCPACGQSNIAKLVSLVSSHGRSGGDSACSGKACSTCGGCK